MHPYTQMKKWLIFSKCDCRYPEGKFSRAEVLDHNSPPDTEEPKLHGPCRSALRDGWGRIGTIPLVTQVFVHPQTAAEAALPVEARNVCSVIEPKR